MKKLKKKYVRAIGLYLWRLGSCFARCGSTRLFIYFAKRAVVYLRWYAELAFENEEEP